jgi:hypothetical protein
MKAKREQIDGELMVIKLFTSNYARDLEININRNNVSVKYDEFEL